MARGGKRTGTPGANYQNRSDMRQAIKVAPGGEYGSRVALERAQHAIPLPNNQVVPPPASPAPSPATPAGAGPPVTPGPFDRPTERPNEPVTAGLPTGPGPGPEVLQSAAPPQGGPDIVGAQLRALYGAASQNGNAARDLLRLIELHDQGY